MFLPRILLVVGIVLSAQGPMQAADPAPVREDGTSQAIEGTIRQFYTSVSKRNVKGVQAVLDTHLLGIEASGNQGQLHIIASNQPEGLLPPEGNDDFDGVTIEEVKAEVSKTHPTVATASFSLVLPVDAETVTRMQEFLNDPVGKLGDANRQALSQVVKDRANRAQMFALLVCQHGTWKIACMTLPK